MPLNRTVNECVLDGESASRKSLNYACSFDLKCFYIIKLIA